MFQFLKPRLRQYEPTQVKYPKPVAVQDEEWRSGVRRQASGFRRQGARQKHAKSIAGETHREAHASRSPVPGMILVPEVTIEKMREAINALHSEGFFDRLITVDRDRRAKADPYAWPPY